MHCAVHVKEKKESPPFSLLPRRNALTVFVAAAVELLSLLKKKEYSNKSRDQMMKDFSLLCTLSYLAFFEILCVSYLPVYMYRSSRKCCDEEKTHWPGTVEKCINFFPSHTTTR